MVVVAEKGGNMERKPSPPPPPPRPPRRTSWGMRPRAAAVKSVTRDEIEKFWRRKRMEEEDHLLAALKAAARIRARTLKEEEYKQFEASLEGVLNGSRDVRKGTGGDEETRKGLVIGHWWTKSKYAYLNQPAVRSMEAEAATTPVSTFVPNSCFCPVVSPKPCSALGVF
uniref:DNA-directed RNA polymerase subunit beta n=1 Tax=Anthurium amnicola TaxID=1678845 RepID=A0A1D1ZDU6_9ARAE